MPAALDCPTCRRPLRLPEEALGQLVQCPLCFDDFVPRRPPALGSGRLSPEPKQPEQAPALGPGHGAPLAYGVEANLPLLDRLGPC